MTGPSRLSVFRRLASRLTSLARHGPALRAYVVCSARSGPRVSRILREELQSLGVEAECTWAEPGSDYEVVGLISSWCQSADCLGVFLDKPWSSLGRVVVDFVDEHAEAVDIVDVVIPRGGSLRGYNVEYHVARSLARGVETVAVVGGVEGLVFVYALCSVGARVRYLIVPEASVEEVERRLERCVRSCRVAVYSYSEEGLAEALGQADMVVLAGPSVAEDKLVAAALNVLVPRVLLDATSIHGSLASRRLTGKTRVICCDDYYRMLLREAAKLMLA